MTKDAPVAPLAQEMPSVWGAVSQEPWIMSKYTIRISHNIAVSKYVHQHPVSSAV